MVAAVAVAMEGAAAGAVVVAAAAIVEGVAGVVVAPLRAMAESDSSPTTRSLRVAAAPRCEAPHKGDTLDSTDLTPPQTNKKIGQHRCTNCLPETNKKNPIDLTQLGVLPVPSQDGAHQ